MDVFTHVPAELFTRQWEIIQFYVLSGAKPDEHLHMLKLAGMPEEEIQASEKRHKETFNQAVEWYMKCGFVEPFIYESVQHSLQVLTRLWLER